MNQSFSKAAIAAYLFFVLLAPLNGVQAVAPDSGQIDSQLRSLIKFNGLSGDPLVGIQTPDIASKKAQLGMRLFWSKSLSGDRDSACVTCHHPVLGGGDNLSLSIGTEAVFPDLLGPGREHDAVNGKDYTVGPTSPRNAPTTLNLAAWKKTLFHDGRVQRHIPADGSFAFGFNTPDSGLDRADPFAGSTLAEAQARFPVTAAEEMKGFGHAVVKNQPIRDKLAARIGAYGKESNQQDAANKSYWLELFRAAYDQPNAYAWELITEQNIFSLISEYERSQVFIDSPWKAYIDGDKQAISERAKQGAWLFFASREAGGANCVSCHQGDLFSDEDFHNLAMPQIGRGKGDGRGHDDFGRYRETENEADKYAFRTPTLLNVEVTGPWSHAGAYTSLSEVIWHHLNPQISIDSYVVEQLTQPDVQHIKTMQRRTQLAVDADSFEGMNLGLFVAEVDDLVLFLETLTDPCVKSRQCLEPWILDASDGDVDPNGDQLMAKDLTGQDL